jgi:hypothetical protein
MYLNKMSVNIPKSGLIYPENIIIPPKPETDAAITDERWTV